MKQATFFPLSAVRLLPGILKERQEIDHRYLIEVLDPERMLAPYYASAKLPSSNSYGGWEGTTLAGVAGGHYLSALAACYAATGDQRALGRAKQFVAGIDRCQQKHGDGYACAVDKNCFEKLRRGIIVLVDKYEPYELNGVWVPLYNLHKLLAGLRDAYRLCGITIALEIARKQAEYLLSVWENLNDVQIQEILRCEYGGIAEALIALTADTGDHRFLELANRAFYQKSALDPLRAGRDVLDGVHPNIQNPKIIGLAELYNVAGDENARFAAEFFFDRVVNFRTFAHGGMGEDEHYFTPGSELEHLTPFTTETCPSYNMIKLAEHIFEWEPRSQVIDYVERVLLNHIVANIGRQPGEFGYFLSLAPVAIKAFSTPEDSFWCCVCTGMESPMRYGRTIFAHSGDTLWINHYFPAELTWNEKQLKLTMSGDFPETEKIDLKLSLGTPIQLTLKLRRPGWCAAMKLIVNGESISTTYGSDGYLVLNRFWNDGDHIKVELPMAYRSEILPGSDYQAFFYGPTLLAGVLPKVEAGDDPAKERSGDHLKVCRKTNEFPPHLIAEHYIDDPHKAKVMPEMKLDWMPLYRVYEEHYCVYLRVMNHSCWQKHEVDLHHQAELEKLRQTAVVDEIIPGVPQSEEKHHLRELCSNTGVFHQRPFRRALPGGGEFSYELKIDPSSPMILQLWYRGAWWKPTRLVIQVDGVSIAELHTTQPGDCHMVDYLLPSKITEGKRSVRVAIRHLDGADLGVVFRLRMIRKFD